MKITILGGGFGLYGYLPALLQSCSVTIVLPMRYQSSLLAREDICHFYDDIEWEDDNAILEQCDGVIFALPPAQQYSWIKKSLEYKNITHFFLEKPLAVSPLLGNELLDLLIASEKKFRMGYNFRYTQWGKSLLNASKDIDNIIWNFRAHHYAKNIQTWKRVHGEGGGALRFYGIHLIALMAEVGYRQVNFSKIKAEREGEVEDWEAELTGDKLTKCKLCVATNSDKVNFLISNKNGSVYADTQPFETKIHTNSAMDKRIPFLIEGLLDLFNPATAPYFDWYKQANELWHKIEASSS